MIQPLVYIGLDVLSLAFTKKSYTGIISEDDVPWEGYNCAEDGSLGQDAEWCGKLSYYADQLGYTTGQSDSFVSNSSIVLSTRMARRLSEITGEPIVGVLDLGQLADAVQAILASVVVLLGTLSDIVFHVAWTVLSEVFELLFDLFMTVVKAISAMFLMLIRSGAFKVLLRIGIELLIILLIDIGIPLLIKSIELLLCFVDFTQISGWDEQLDCIERTCFQTGSDDAALAEVFHTFSSVPDAADQMKVVFLRLVNVVTGQRYAGETSGRIELPEVGDISEKTPRTNVCASCFNCKVPEARAVFLVTATIYGCVLDGQKYSGRIQQSCLTNGPGYVELCGPRSYLTDLMSDSTWASLYPLHKTFDLDLAQSYATRFETLSKDLGGPGGDGYTAHYLAQLWFQRDVGLGENQAAKFVRAVCRQMREVTSLTREDGGPTHTEYPPGSMQELALGFSYEW